MFPYPSGRLHMGHFRIYSIADTIARFRRALGHNVLHPMGWDAFGLPAENAAFDRKIHPAAWTRENIEHMKIQLKDMGTSFDWSREISTIDPSYYRWTQSIFLKMFKAGLAYRADAWVNWDPVDKTVLANEQVDDRGRADRSGALVERRKLRQWFFRTTHYAEELLADLDALDWPNHVKQRQRAWIGKSQGWEVDFRVWVSSAPAPAPSPNLTVFCPDISRLMDVDYLAISPDHLFLSDWYLPKANAPQVLEYTKTIKVKIPHSPSASHGCFTGLFGVHPITGKPIPIFVSEALMANHAAESVIGTPTHEAADAKFARVHRIMPLDDQLDTKSVEHQLSASGLGRVAVRYQLRDWLVSRQRYWGTPMPLVHCDSCGVVPLNESNLPLVLPADLHDVERGVSPLAHEWSNCKCPKCKKPARRETDTMDTFVDSSWYWLRYCDPNNSETACDTSLASQNLPVDLYMGGVEHSTMHLLYARFMAKFLRDQGMLGDSMAKVDSNFSTQRETFHTLDAANVRVKSTGAEPVITFEKMSKSKHNGVDPEDIIKEYGSDAARLHILYRAAPFDELLWEENGVLGMSRWLVRVWSLVNEQIESEKQGDQTVEGRALQLLTNQVIKEVTTCLKETYHFHTAISNLIKFTHELQGMKSSSAFDAAIRTLVGLMTPFAPCIGSEMKQILGISEINWPEVMQVAESEAVELIDVVIMVNGKTRGIMNISTGLLQNSGAVEAAARDSEIFKKWVQPTQQVKRVVVASGGKVINFVV
ncbi:leucine---tRNA ligase [Synchytrium microbalum]|uniref:leucine--tRNA ligase n=1 Tax=Synchytrium microbalum TaxID=1806994 RepID=A0A507CF60_9FUNG|nr:leucine---tRNA ligase [Synchytrium microbalum]TPX38131.1 leucine---tRNA ligase [Synchytrium microbalum]